VSVVARLEATVGQSLRGFARSVAEQLLLHRPGSVEALDAQQGAIGLTKLSRVGDDTSHPRIARARRQFVKQFVKCHALDELLVLDFVDGSGRFDSPMTQGQRGLRIRSHDTQSRHKVSEEKAIRISPTSLLSAAVGRLPRPQ